MIQLWGAVGKRQGNERLDSPGELALEAGMNRSIEESIRAKLTVRLAPALIEVADESALHAGHAGARPGGETHFRVRIVSSAFSGLTRVARQRLVYEALSEEFARGVHALALVTQTPEEVVGRGSD
jgi:BolA protein